jgi:nicotinamide-nucleotide amidase
MSPVSFARLAEAVLAHHRRAGTRLATAESCTGGAIAAALTDIAGSSDVFERGFVTYSNEAKAELLGVPAALITAHGAVSHEVAAAMAEGALAHSRADVAVSVTGIAGPGGGTPTKPVGLVYIGNIRRGSAPIVERHVFTGDRAAVRAASVKRALELLLASGPPG